MKIVKAFLFSLTLCYAVNSAAADLVRTKIEFKHQIGKVNKVGGIPLGGLSGLVYSGKVAANGKKSGDKIILWSLTDRGPNSEPMSIRGDGVMDRILLLPEFSPRLIKLEYDLKNRKVEVSKVIGLTNPLGFAASGRSNVDPTTAAEGFDERLVGPTKQPLALDPWGLDPESIAIDEKGFFWVGEEYGPSILKIAPDGRILSRFLPVAASAARNGVRALPNEFGERELNRGFEALAIHGTTLYAFLQSPLVVRDSLSLVRVLAFDISREAVLGTYYYPLSMLDAKIGDASVGPDGKMYVLEHRTDKKKKIFHRAIFEVDFTKATNLLIEPDKAKAIPANVKRVADFTGIDEFEKLEGLAVLSNKEFLILNDNDFNVDRIMALKEGKKPPERVNSFLFHSIGVE